MRKIVLVAAIAAGALSLAACSEKADEATDETADAAMADAEANADAAPVEEAAPAEDAAAADAAAAPAADAAAPAAE